MVWWPIGNALDSLPKGPRFESSSGLFSYCVIHVSKVRKFTHSYSRSTQPSHPSAGGKNEERLFVAAITTCSLDSLAPSQGTRSVSWCQAEGYNALGFEPLRRKLHSPTGPLRAARISKSMVDPSSSLLSTRWLLSSSKIFQRY